MSRRRRDWCCKVRDVFGERGPVEDGMHSPTPRVQHIVYQGQCILLFQAVRVADDFCVGPKLVDFVGEFLIWIRRQVGAGVDAGGAVSYHGSISLDRLCCI